MIVIEVDAEPAVDAILAQEGTQIGRGQAQSLTIAADHHNLAGLALVIAQKLLRVQM